MNNFIQNISGITKSLEEETSTNESLLAKVDSANTVLDSEWIKSVCNHNDAMSNEDRIKISLFCRQANLHFFLKNFTLFAYMCTLNFSTI